MTELSDAVAVVTGASRGLGKDVADALSARGVRVASVSRTAERFRTDVRDPEQVARLAREVVEELGTPTILVNAAGTFGPLERFRDTDPAAWIETMTVDAIGPYLTSRAFVGGMIDAGWGRIVNVTSAASLHPPGALGSAYATAKAALNQLTRHLAADLEDTGVTANVIHPGDVRTAMWADIRDQAARLGEVAQPFTEWADWVEETGGDPPAKAVDLVLQILESDVNGRFLWVEEPLQPPIPSWGDGAELQPWRERSS
jgi:NAD(P)-dependent dehydrogenase (short-subunit alcohol dehydrogenase family)